MTPIFMLKMAESRFDGRHDALTEYLRTEYGSHDSSWILADGDRLHKKSDGLDLVARLRRWLSEKSSGASPEGANV